MASVNNEGVGYEDEIISNEIDDIEQEILGRMKNTEDYTTNINSDYDDMEPETTSIYNTSLLQKDPKPTNRTGFLPKFLKNSTRNGSLGAHQKLATSDDEVTKFNPDTMERVIIGEEDEVLVNEYGEYAENDDEYLKHYQQQRAATSHQYTNVQELEEEYEGLQTHNDYQDRDDYPDQKDEDDPDEIYRQGMVGNHKDPTNMLIFLPLLGVLVTIAVMVGIELQDRALKKSDTGSNFKDPLKDNTDPLIPRASKNLANICDATVVKDQVGYEQCNEECMVALCCVMLEGTVGFCFFNATVDNCATYKPCKTINSVFGLLPDYDDPIKTNPNVDPMEDTPNQGGIVVPPEYGDIFKILADVCGPVSWATDKGKQDCYYYCKDAKCCFSSVNEQCFGGMSKDFCPIYTACTVVYLDNDNDDDFALSINDDGGLGSVGSSTLVSQIESSVTEYCGRDKFATQEGEKLCADMCIPAQCCFASGAAKCTETKDELCSVYAACGVLYLGVEMVQQVCTQKSYHGEGKEDCEKYCDPARCCFNGNENSCWVDMNVNLCYAYSPCAIVYFDNDDNPNSSQIIDAAGSEVSDVVKQTCQTDLLQTSSGKALCKELCFPATCCFATNLLNCLDTNPQLCLAYDGCKALYNPNEQPDAQTRDPEDAALLIHVLVKDACSKENISTVSGRMVCIDLCAPAYCCFDNSPKANCWTDREVYCESFSDCGILGTDDFDSSTEYDVQATKLITEMVKDACSPASLEQGKGKQLCREICIPGKCCFEATTCEFDKRTLCETYRDCGALGQDEFMDMEDVLINSTNDLDYNHIEITMFKAPQVIHMILELACSQNSRNTDEGLALCEEVCIPAACCYASDNNDSIKGSCWDEKLDMCSIYADCGYLYLNNWDGVIADKSGSGSNPFSPSISVIVQDACKEESLVTTEGMDLCQALCIIPECCFLYENNCWDEYHAMCTSYSPCQVMFQVNLSDDDLIISPPQQKVVTMQAACTDDMIESDGGDLCQGYCQPHMCCFAESGSGHECTDISDCGQYAICNVLIDKFTKPRTSTAVAMIYDIVRNKCDKTKYNSSSGQKQQCVDLCIPSRCCFSNNIDINCQTEQSALCNAYSYCGIVQQNDFPALDPQKKSDGREGSTAFISTLISGIVVETCSESNYETENGKGLCDAICTPITACCFGHQDLGEPGCAKSESDFCATFTECWIAYAPPPETIMPTTLTPTFRPTSRPSLKPTALPTSMPITMMPTKTPTTSAPTLKPSVSEANKSFYFVSQTVHDLCDSIVWEESLPSEELISCMEICIPAKRCLDNSVPVDSTLCRAFESCINNLSLENYEKWDNQINRLGSTSVTQALVAGIAVQSCSDLSWAYLQGKELCDAVCFDAGCCFPDSTCDSVDATLFCEVFDGCWRDNASDDSIENNSPTLLPSDYPTLLPSTIQPIMKVGLTYEDCSKDALIEDISKVAECATSANNACSANEMKKDDGKSCIEFCAPHDCCWIDGGDRCWHNKRENDICLSFAICKPKP